MRNILIESLKETPVYDHQVEIVERKGIGHPDSICDSIMEEISIALSQEYLNNFGAIMHHNVDKGLLLAGSAQPKLGGGEVLEPMRIIFGDRATFEAKGVRLPIEKIIRERAAHWFRENLRFVDPEKYIEYDIELKPGSPELVDIFLRQKGGLLQANDTSAAVGYAPLTQTEKLVLETETFLNSKSLKETFPEVGEDIKVMGYRQDKELHLTIAMAFVDRFVDSEATYYKRKKEILEATQEHIEKKREGIDKIHVYVNTLDEPGRPDLGGMYLTVTGTSAENADSGEVGRGNRVNGLIALNRPMGTEAAAGKNPVSHVGKIYNFLTHKIANEVYTKTKGVREVYIWLCSQIGVTIDHPLIASAQITLEPGVSVDKIAGPVREIIDSELADIGSFTQELSNGKYPVC